MQQSRSILAAIAADLAANYFVNTDKMVLFLSTFVPAGNSTIADFIANRVANGDILPFTLTEPWLPGISGDGEGLLIYNGLADFIAPNGTTSPVIAGGWFIADTGLTDLKLFGVFEAPINFDNDLDELLVKPSMTFPVDADADSEFIDAP